MATSFLSMPCNWIQVLVLLTLALDVVAKWNATGNLRTIWVTHVMEYRDLFSPEQAGMFAEDVKKAYGDFLVERSDPATRRGIKPQSEHSSTPADKDRINEEFFNYQGRHPINEATLEIVWQAFCYAVARFVKEADLPPIDYQRETAEGGSLEWVTTAVGMPRRGRQYCWGSVQSEGTHHDIHVHPGSALAGTLYLSVPLDGGALTLSDPRGPMPPFNTAYRIAPEVGMFVLFPGTLPHGVHGTPGPIPRVSISCNFPGDWNKYTKSKTVFDESHWSHEMMSRDEAIQVQKRDETSKEL